MRDFQGVFVVCILRVCFVCYQEAMSGSNSAWQFLFLVSVHRKDLIYTVDVLVRVFTDASACPIRLTLPIVCMGNRKYILEGKFMFELNMPYSISLCNITLFACISTHRIITIMCCHMLTCSSHRLWCTDGCQNQTLPTGVVELCCVFSRYLDQCSRQKAAA